MLLTKLALNHCSREKFLDTKEKTDYIDSAINFATNYCYKVKAIYDAGESNPSNDECTSVTDPDDLSSFMSVNLINGLAMTG